VDVGLEPVEHRTRGGECRRRHAEQRRGAAPGEQELRLRTNTRPAVATRSIRVSATHSVAAPSTLAIELAMMITLSQLSSRYRPGRFDSDAMNTASAVNAAAISASITWPTPRSEGLVEAVSST
jgi:hypothetical protein